MAMNWLAILVAALVPMFMGFIWYNEKLFGKAWMNAIGMNEEQLKSNTNMAKIFGFSLLFSFVLAFSMQFQVIHQMSVAGLFMVDNKPPDPNSEMGLYMKGFFEKFANTHRTWSHGAVHALLSGLFMLFPIIATNALYEKRSWKYVFINAGFWIVSMMIMGAILCAWQ